MSLAAEINRMIDAESSRLRQLVRADGRTRTAIAEAAGIHPVDLSHFVAGRRKFSPKLLGRLAQVIDAKGHKCVK